MDTQPEFGFRDLITHTVGEMAKAICEHVGEGKDQQYARAQAIVHTIMAFLPRDVTEAMIAGHLVMFHELIVDSARDTLRGEDDRAKRASRGNICAMDKAFGENLMRLERYRKRPAEGQRDAPMLEAEIADRIARHAAATAEPGPSPSPEMVATRAVTPEALAALKKGDAAGFARALGVEQPSEAFLAAAAQPGPFNRKDRQTAEGTKSG